MMRALVIIRQPETVPPTYDAALPEDSWGRWIRNHLDEMIAGGWTLIENYIPPAPPVPPA